MKYKVQITDESGNVQQYIVSRSSSSEWNTFYAVFRNGNGDYKQKNVNKIN
jgi:hypothetical protein